MRKSRKLLLGLASLTLTDIAIAEAADLPVKAPPLAPVAIYNWAGFYLGGHAGYRWADPEFSGPGYDGLVSPSPARSASYRTNGGIVGVHAGYNHMLTPTILAGIEGDWTWGKRRASATGSSIDDLGDGFIFRSEVELTWQATFRGRLGVVNGQWLLYGTGGVAFARIRWTDNTTEIFVGDPIAASSSDAGKTLTGYVVGVGAEYLWRPNWIARVEYLYENFGDVSLPFGTGSQVGKLDLKDVSKIRVGISYKFGP
jgi:outer membrane immunogenic protein